MFMANNTKKIDVVALFMDSAIIRFVWRDFYNYKFCQTAILFMVIGSVAVIKFLQCHCIMITIYILFPMFICLEQFDCTVFVYD